MGESTNGKIKEQKEQKDHDSGKIQSRLIYLAYFFFKICDSNASFVSLCGSVAKLYSMFF